MLDIKGVCKRLGDFRLEDVNITVGEGEYFVILGPTGSGKTVLLEILSGLYRPDKGSIIYGERDLTHLYPEDRRMGFVYQDYMLFPHLTVRENIEFGLKARKKSPEEAMARLQDMAQRMGIGHIMDRYPATLSGGEQQRTAMARALVTSPDILLMDEPLSALDPNTKGKFQKLLKDVHEDMKTTTVHITHDFCEALCLADRIAVMDRGRVVQIGKPQEIFKRPCSRFVADFVGIENIFDARVDGEKAVISPEFHVRAPFGAAGSATVTMRPEDISICREREKDLKNSIRARITDISCVGVMAKIYLDAGVGIVSCIPSNMAKEMDIRVGEDIWAVFDDLDVNIF